MNISDNVAMAPGPGYYDPKPAKNRQVITGTGTMNSRVSALTTFHFTSILFHLLKTKRFPPPNFITPGPGAYNVSQSVGNSVVMLQPQNVEVIITLILSHSLKLISFSNQC